MRMSIWIKLGLLLPLIFLADYLLMVLLGCSSCLFGFGKDFYCGTYYLIGKIILVASAAFFLSLIYLDIKKLFKKRSHAQTGA